MTDPKTAARTVAERLSTQDISIKHVQALDLVAAGCGYQDRSKLSDIAALPLLKHVNIKLLTSAATVLARHDLTRRQTIIDTTSSVILPEKHEVSPVADLRDLPYLNAIVRSDDHRAIAHFDAAHTINKMEVHELQALVDIGWGGNSEADDVAYDNEASDANVAEVLNYARIGKTGFECHIDPQEGAEWLRQNRPDAARLIIEDGEPLLIDFPTFEEARTAEAERWYQEYDFGRWTIEASNGWSTDTSSNEVTRRIYVQRPGRDGDTIAGDFIVSFLNGAVQVESVIARLDDIGDTGTALDPNKLNIKSEGNHFSFSVDDLANPENFLSTDEGQKLIHHIADTTWSAWSNQKSISNALCNEIAHDLIAAAKARAKGDDNVSSDEIIVAQHLTASEPEDSWFDYASSRWQDIANDISEAIDNGFQDNEGFNEEAWNEHLRDAHTDFIIENDTSSALDCIGTQDTTEVMFWLISPKDNEDDLIQIDGNVPESTQVEISDQFQFALAKLGYTTSEWRNHTGSKMPSELSGTRPARGMGHTFNGSYESADSLISLEDLVTIIDNGCTQNFGLVLYSVVSLTDLIGLDLSRPIAFSSAHVALYNAYAGTFMDHKARPGRVIVQHGIDGKLNGLLGDSPLEFCGLVSSYYAGRLSDPEKDDHHRLATTAFDAALAEIPFVSGDENNTGMKRRYPGHAIYWEYSDEAKTSLNSCYGIGVTNRYDRDYRQVDASYDIATGKISFSDRPSKRTA